MRVCLVSNLYPPEVVGGAEIMVGHLARGLAAAGHEVTVLTTSRAGREERARVDGVEVYRVPTPNLYWPGAAPHGNPALKPLWHLLDLWNPRGYSYLRRLLAQGRIDVIHTHNLPGLSPAVWSAARSAQVPLVHTIHDYSLTCIRALRMTWRGHVCTSPCLDCLVRGAWLRRLGRSVRAVTAPSRFVLDRHVEIGFFTRASLAVIPWGLSGVVPASKESRPAPVRFLYVGQLRRHKGVRSLLDAFARVGNPCVRLDIAGDGDMRPECEAAAAADPRITVHGFAGSQNVARLYRSSHVLVFPPVWWEVFGLVVLEAFAHGLPVLATRIGGIPELVEDGVTGFLVAPGDVEALAGRMDALARDPELVAQMSARCLARASELTLDRTIDELVRVYGEVKRA